jgi:transposase
LSDSEILALKAEVLRTRALLQEREKTLLEKEMELAKKDAAIAEKNAAIAEKEAQIALYRRMLFGQKRERFTQTIEGQLTLPFDVDTGLLKQILEEKDKEREKNKKESNSPKEPRGAHPGRFPLPKNLKVVTTILEPPGDLTDMVCIGEEVTEVLEMKPAEYYIHRIVRRKYAPKSGEGSFKIALLPGRVIDKSMVGTGIITQAIVDKYVDHMPIYRQLQRLAREGIHLKEPTLHHWVRKGIEKLEILYNFLWERNIKRGYLQVDETTIKVLESEKKNKTHLGYYWVYFDPLDNIPIFKYERGRGGHFPAHQLEGFKGFLQTDGYPGYIELGKKEEVIHIGCWAHARRKFDAALSNNTTLATEALTMIQALYSIEREAKEQQLNPEQIKELRLSKSLPIANLFFKWVAQNVGKVLPKSQIGIAFNFVYKRYDPLMGYLYNGKLHIDNNAVENSIRPVALGRKNYLFCKTHESAQRGAIIYTFMAICKKHNVNPHEWLQHTLSTIDDTSIQQLETLLPQNFNKKDVVA